jgi:hypothetical protein
MALVHIEGIKIVAAGGDLDAAVALRVSKDAVDLDIPPEILERHNTLSPQPAARTELGFNVTLKAALENAGPDEYVLLFGGVNTSGVWTKSQGVRALGKLDIRLVVFQEDGTTKDWDITNVQQVAGMKRSFTYAQTSYQPIELAGTDNTALDFDES